MKRKRILCAALILAMSVCMAGCSGCSGRETENSFTPKPVDGTALLFDEGMQYYNVAPAVVEESESVRYVFYAVNKTADAEDTAVAVRKGEKNGETWTYGEKKVIIERSASGWDSAHIENPDVVKGSFGYRGETYSYLMAYQGNDAKTEDNYSVGLAVAKDPLGEWTKVGETAVLSYDKTGYGSAFGIGEPSLVSFDKAGKVYLFHTMGDMYTTGVYVAELDCSDLGAIKGAGISNAVSNYGITDPGAPLPTFSDANFKLDTLSETLYTVRNYYPVAAVKPSLPTAVQVLKMPVADLYKPTAAWEVIETQVNDLDLATETTDGWERVYSGCIVGDAYGHTDGAKMLELVLSVTSYDKTTFEYRFYQGLTSFSLTLED